MPTKPSKTLETFVNPHPERDYLIRITIPEFTCLCPKTGQPDFAVLYLEYIADQKCVELKSLKQYVWSYRNEGAFHEAVTNKILDDLVAATDARYMQLRADFNVRGGIYTNVTVEHRKKGWSGSPLAQGLEAETRPDPSRAPSSAAPAAPAARARARARAPAAAAPSKPTARAEEAAEPEPGAVYVGIDIGTSGCRAVAIDAEGRLLAQAATPIPAPTRHEGQVTQDPRLWWQAVVAALRGVLSDVGSSRVEALAVDATSGTILLCDKSGTPLTPALMYDDSRAQAQAERIAAVADRRSGAHGAASALAKLLWLHDKRLDVKAAHVLHQADWIAGKLTGIWGTSDYNNSLKLGYDGTTLAWPAWFADLGVPENLLPRVLAPGDDVGTVSSEMTQLLGLRPGTRVVAGTTDGVAGFLAAGAHSPGQAVTSLGSTLILKLLSTQPVFAPEYGVYSHRLGDRWLVGGASNSGAAVLLQYFSPEQMREMTPALDPEQFTGLKYYPLPGVGERFPVNDPQMMPVLEPLPGDSTTFFQGLLEGIARVEAEGYALLARLGAPPVSEILTTGGGADNSAWTRLRERLLGVPIHKASLGVPGYGAALLARGQRTAQAA
jgi:7-cyano-7-deazaguanine reductase